MRVCAHQPSTATSPKSCLSPTTQATAWTRTQEAVSPRELGGHAREQGVTASEADRRRTARPLTHSHPERYVPREAPTQPARAGATEVLTGAEARVLAHRHTNNQEGPRLTQTCDAHLYTHTQTDPQTQLPSKTHGHRPHACRHPKTPQSVCPPGRKPLAGLMG